MDNFPKSLPSFVNSREIHIQLWNDYIHLNDPNFLKFFTILYSVFLCKVFTNTTVMTIYPVTQEQTQAFILDSSLATLCNMVSKASNFSLSPTPMLVLLAFIFPLSLKWSLLRGGIHFHLEPWNILKDLNKAQFLCQKKGEIKLTWSFPDTGDLQEH